MAADKDVELVEVTHSVSIPIIRARKTFGQVYRQKYLTIGGGRRQNQGERLPRIFAKSLDHAMEHVSGPAQMTEASGGGAAAS
jgi:hypothetical protein